MNLARRATSCGMGWIYVLVGLSVFVGSPARSGAQARAPGRATPWLQIDAGADRCVSAPTLAREVEGLLADEPHEGVRVLARARARGWVVAMRHGGGQHAVREFPVLPEDCELRVRALALSIALAVEHGGAATPSQVVAPDERERGWAIGLHAGGSLGELPRAAAISGLELRMERRRWVPLELRALADIWTDAPDFAGGRLSTRQLLGAIGSCVGPPATEAFRFDVCLGVELGAVLGRAEGVARPERAAAGSGALNMGLGGRWAPRRRLALTVRLEGFARFWTPRFRVLQADGAPFAERRLPPAGGRLSFGLAWLSP